MYNGDLKINSPFQNYQNASSNSHYNESMGYTGDNNKFTKNNFSYTEKNGLEGISQITKDIKANKF